MKRLLWLGLLFPVIALAQVQKCQINGKTVYSDSQCGQEGQAISATVNSLDTSGMRDQVAKRDEKAAADAAREKVSARAARKQRDRMSGPCPGMEGAAYQSCQSDRIKKLGQKMAPRQ